VKDNNSLFIYYTTTNNFLKPSCFLIIDFSPNVMKNRLNKHHSISVKSDVSAILLQNDRYWRLTPTRLSATPRCRSNLQRVQCLLLIKLWILFSNLARQILLYTSRRI